MLLLFFLGSCTFWILPFTSGGFLNIALVNVLPDLLKEKDPWYVWNINLITINYLTNN